MNLNKTFVAVQDASRNMLCLLYTSDIGYDLVSKANDQVEFSAGWGQTGIIGKLSLKFTNFSLSNLCLLYTSRRKFSCSEGYSVLPTQVTLRR